MARKKPAPKISEIDQFKSLLRMVRKELPRFRRRATEELESYRVAADFARDHKIPGASDFLKAMLLCWQGKDAEALAVVESVATVLPETLSGHWWNIKGVILSGLNLHDEAIACLEKALASPGFDTPGHAYNNMGNAYRRKKDYDRAIECYRNALDTPGYETPGMAHNNMGLAFKGKKELDLAIECFQKALDTPGHNSVGGAQHNMGNMYSLKKQYDRAIECYRNALDTPGYDAPHLTRVNLANALREKKDWPNARTEIERVLSEPDDENQHSRAKYIQGMIQEEMAGITPTPDEEALACSSSRSDADSPEERMLTKLQGSKTDQKDKYQIYLQRPSSPRDNLFSCLRGWSSSVTLLEGGNESQWRGGGYFLKWRNRGIVIDPGFDFIDNFHDAEFTGKEISAVLVSHNHSDHNYDLRSLDDLRYELHKRWKTLNPVANDLKNYVVVVDEDTVKGFAPGPDPSRFRQLETFDIKKSVRKKWLCRPVDIPMTVEHFPVEHGDDVSHAVGMRLVLHSETAEPDFVVGYTGDTEYFDVLSNHLQGCHVLIAHISMPDVEELGADLSATTHSKKRHLGLNGTAKVITEAMPKLTLVGEFWAGRADIRIELIQALRRRTGNNAILPAGIGFHLHLPSLEVECTNCQKKVPHDKIKIAPAATPFGPLGYLCSNCLT
jgi:tetratricopeptide (TPR) repeat protein/ribonuclease BN (tRNA processing enzyme)